MAGSTRKLITLRDTLSELNKSQKTKSTSDVSSSSISDTCYLCYLNAAVIMCTECNKKMCEDCDSNWHLKSNRQNHQRSPIPKNISTPRSSPPHTNTPPPSENVTVPRVEPVITSTDSSPPSPVADVCSNWICTRCTLVNTPSFTHCDVCGQEAPKEEERQVRGHQVIEKENRKNSEFMLNILNVLKSCELSGVLQPMVELTVKYWLSTRRENEPFAPLKCFENLKKYIGTVSLQMKKTGLRTDVHPSEVEWILRHEGFSLGDLNVAAICCERRKTEVQRLSNILVGVRHKDIHNAIGKVGCRTVDVNRYLNRSVLPKGCLKKLSELRQDAAQETFQKRIMNDRTDKEIRIRCCVVEQDLTWGKAEILMKLLDDTEVKEAEHDMETIVSSVQEDSMNFVRAKKFLLHQCGACYGFFTKLEMESFPLCGCELCQECFHNWLTQCVTETEPPAWQCNICNSPEAEDRDNFQRHLCFIQLIMQSRTKMSDYMDRFHLKVNNWSFKNNPDFRWCAHKCQNGFMYNGPDKKMQCPTCKKYTCKDCSKQWEEEHQGKTCEEFEAYKLANDPEMLNYFDEFGIQCPNPSCKWCYDLAPGACEHFKCTHCPTEFCGGCYNYITIGSNCARGEACKSMGMHAHHPRNCFTYLRDWDVPTLKKVLDSGKVDYSRDLQGHKKCQVKVFTPNALEQGSHPCAEDVFDGTDLCLKHYKEYLVRKINRSHLDPAPFIDEIVMLNQTITREQLTPPPRAAGEVDDVYRKKLVEFIQQKIPLPRLK